MSGDFHALVVANSVEEIDGAARSLAFDVPEALASAFTWRAGQHVTLRLTVAGHEVRRSYSISAAPVSGDPLRITVKRVEGGLVSNYINDSVRDGDVLDVMPPFGGFCLDTNEADRRTHYFFGAGSGITPLYAMLHSVLIAEPHSFAHLVYGNTSASSILFKENFQSLLDEFPDRLRLHHVLSAPSLWSGFRYWRRGVIDEKTIEAFINENPPYAQDAQYYICGPGSMNKTVEAALRSLDVPSGRIHSENYGGSVDLDESVKGIAATAIVELDGSTHSVPISEQETILDASRLSGLTPPFSCQSGVCGACRAQLLRGTAHMRARMALNNSDIESGAILTCQSVATSAELSLTYDT